MRIWYTKEVETNAAKTERTEFGNRICDLHMGYDWYIEHGHNPITMDNIKETHVSAIDLGTWEIRNSLEEMFVRYQAENMSPELRSWLRGRTDLSHMSMSVGDIIETNDGVLHIVDGVGFVTLEG